MVASTLFPEDDRKAISAAVGEAEKKTSAEIVPVVASASDRYERAEDLAGLASALVAVAAAWTQFGGLRPSADWDGEPHPMLHLAIVLAVFAAGWIAGVLAAKAVPWVKRLTASRRAMATRVLQAAHHSFNALHAHKTAGGTGVVIFVSLFERRVCVWADKAVSAKIPESEWKGITEQMIRSLRDGKPREGFVEAIRKTGELLAKHFPVQPGDVNELSNELRILD